MTRPNQPLAVEHVSWHDSRVRVDAQGTLIIQGVAPEDAGNYSCQAANDVGTDEKTVTLYYAGTRVEGICRRRISSPPSLPPSHPQILTEHLPCGRHWGYSSEHRVPIRVELIF